MDSYKKLAKTLRYSTPSERQFILESLTPPQRAEVLIHEEEYMKSPKDKMIHTEEVRTQ